MPRQTKIGTEVARVTYDSDTTFKVKRSKVNWQGAGVYCGGLPHILYCALGLIAHYKSHLLLLLLIHYVTVQLPTLTWFFQVCFSLYFCDVCYCIFYMVFFILYLEYEFHDK